MLKDYLVQEDSIKLHLEKCAKQIARKKKLAIWGAARGGAKCMEFLERYKLFDREIYFLDNDITKQGKKYYGKMVYAPSYFEKEDKKQTLVAITCADYENVKTQLESLCFLGGGGVETILLDLAWVDFEFSYFDFVNENLYMFSETYELLADEKSKQVFANVLNYKMTKNIGYTGDICEDFGNQYFDSDIIHLGNKEVFVDCGAYNGDTLKKFLDQVKGKFKAAYCFEPNSVNINEINTFIKERNLTGIKTFAIAVNDRKEKLSFDSESNNGASSGFLNKNGKNLVQADSIDHVLQGEAVTFIKMDVEGAEEKALLGAVNTIRKHKPILAVCAYHKKEDFYYLVSLILQIEPSYQIYFRHYSKTDFETVIYAVQKENGE